MNVKALIMQPYQIGPVMGAAMRLQGTSGHIQDLFFAPQLVKFLLEQFVLVDKRNNIDGNPAKYSARIAECENARSKLGYPEIGPSQVVRNIGFDETSNLLILTAMCADSIPLHFDFDEVAVNAMIGELGELSLALGHTQGKA